jgi:enterochelin esterase family protein
MRVALTAPAWATHWLSDLTDWQRRPRPVAAMAPFTLPDDVYFEYAYRAADGALGPDPGNTRPRLNPWWPHACNLVGPEYRPDPVAQVGSARPQGRLERRTLASCRLGQRRSFYLYSPVGCAGDPLPHVLFQDGKAYLGWGKVAQVLDRLVACGDVPPAHLVLVPPVNRTREYAFDAAYCDFVADELVPAADAARPCDGTRVAWGASLGGLAAAWQAWRHPDLFATVVAQSGGFLYDPGQDLADPFRGGEWFARTVAAEPVRPLRWYLDCGTLEWLHGPNVRLAAGLRARGYAARLVLRHAGHNWQSWRDGLAGALRFALA